jgi:hypothetical protein
MAAGVPVLANAASEVLAGHCRRSGAGLYYSSGTEFDEALELLLADAGLRRHMAAAGRLYVQRHYRWDLVLEAMDWAIGQVAPAGAHRAV